MNNDLQNHKITKTEINDKHELLLLLFEPDFVETFSFDKFPANFNAVYPSYPS